MRIFLVLHLHSFRFRPNFKSCNFCCNSANDTILFRVQQSVGKKCTKKMKIKKINQLIFLFKIET